MKKILILSCCLLSGLSYAATNLEQGSAAVDDKYVEEIKNQETAQKKINENDKSDLTLDEKKAIQRQDEREGKPALEEDSGTVWGNEESQDVNPGPLL
jgi:hypothetical protein